MPAWDWVACLLVEGGRPLLIAQAAAPWALALSVRLAAGPLACWEEVDKAEAKAAWALGSWEACHRQQACGHRRQAAPLGLQLLLPSSPQVVKVGDVENAFAASSSCLQAAQGRVNTIYICPLHFIHYRSPLQELEGWHGLWPRNGV